MAEGVSKQGMGMGRGKAEAGEEKEDGTKSFYYLRQSQAVTGRASAEISSSAVVEEGATTTPRQSRDDSACHK
jgi:hypothetical protein